MHWAVVRPDGVFEDVGQEEGGDDAGREAEERDVRFVQVAAPEECPEQDHY